MVFPLASLPRQILYSPGENSKKACEVQDSFRVTGAWIKRIGCNLNTRLTLPTPLALLQPKPLWDKTQHVQELCLFISFCVVSKMAQILCLL